MRGTESGGVVLVLIEDGQTEFMSEGAGAGADVLVLKIEAERGMSYFARSDASRILSMVKYRSFTYPSSSSTLPLSLRFEWCISLDPMHPDSDRWVSD
ncbi:hypothetical protein VPNG_07348 [Cytospora leucostoma]|uniref:Uncharacterized protein n=1 Tax=Cytospora leucostoma TaxID=1230097 RepID=A0A423WUZ8_9PEZI|nr:hypothetical protein VPNG_07348 [Cytospora leucostoma]